MKNKKTINNNVQIFTPVGVLDSQTSPDLEAQFESVIDHGINRLVVDCHKLDYISSSGLRVFCNTVKKLKNCKGIFILCSLEEYIEELFEISGLDTFITIKNSLDEALIHINTT